MTDTPSPLEDPNWQSVQVQVRMPWWRRKQLHEHARKLDVSIAALVLDCIDRQIKPEPPK